MDRVSLTEDGQVEVATPPHPESGERRVVLDPLEFIHAVGRQVPNPRQHLVRYYGSYANRSRRQWQERWSGSGWGRVSDEDCGEAGDAGVQGPRAGSRPGSRSGSWARLLRRILEVDPLLCPRCDVEMVVVSVITDPQVVDRILNHRGRGRGQDPFAERAPPRSGAFVETETAH